MAERLNENRDCEFYENCRNSKGGGWSTDGCRLASRDNSTVTCECDHLTNFAVLMDRTGTSSVSIVFFTCAFKPNRIYYKILARDWFAARVTQL